MIIVHSFDNCWYCGRNWTHIHALVSWVTGVSMGHVMQNAEVAPWPEPEISSKNPSMEEQLVRVWDLWNRQLLAMKTLAVSYNLNEHQFLREVCVKQGDYFSNWLRMGLVVWMGRMWQNLWTRVQAQEQRKSNWGRVWRRRMYWTSRRIGMFLPRGVALWLITACLYLLPINLKNLSGHETTGKIVL